MPPTITPQGFIAKWRGDTRKERARRWASAPDMRGYPALAATPAEKAERKPKSTNDPT